MCVCHTKNVTFAHKFHLPLSQVPDFRPLFCINGFISLNKGEVGLGSDIGCPSESIIKRCLGNGKFIVISFSTFVLKLFHDPNKKRVLIAALTPSISGIQFASLLPLKIFHTLLCHSILERAHALYYFLFYLGCAFNVISCQKVL